MNRLFLDKQTELSVRALEEYRVADGGIALRDGNRFLWSTMKRPSNRVVLHSPHDVHFAGSTREKLGLKRSPFEVRITKRRGHVLFIEKQEAYVGTTHEGVSHIAVGRILGYMETRMQAAGRPDG